MGELILVRHGHTGLNQPGPDERLRGWLDVPLDEQGLREAAETSERLAAYSVQAIYCSDLRRARQTAEILRKRSKAPVTATVALRPWNLGMFGGHRVRDILPFLSLLNQRPDVPAPGGESFHQFYGRYSCQLQVLLDMAEQSPAPIVAVTHVRNLLATATFISGGDRDRVPVRGGPATGTLTILHKNGPQWVSRSDHRYVVDGNPGSKVEMARTDAKASSKIFPTLVHVSDPVKNEGQRAS